MLMAGKKIHSQVTKNQNGIPNSRHVSTNQPTKRCTIRRQKRAKKAYPFIRQEERKKKENIPPPSLVHRGQDRGRVQSGELKTAPRLAPKGRGKLHIWLSRMLAFLSALICSPIITLINRRCKSASVQPIWPVPPF